MCGGDEEGEAGFAPVVFVGGGKAGPVDEADTGGGGVPVAFWDRGGAGGSAASRADESVLGEKKEVEVVVR